LSSIKKKMIKEFTINQAEIFTGNEVTVKGWIYNKRFFRFDCFYAIRDGTGFIQGTVVKMMLKKKYSTKSRPDAGIIN